MLPSRSQSWNPPEHRTARAPAHRAGGFGPIAVPRRLRPLLLGSICFVLLASVTGASADARTSLGEIEREVICVTCNVSLVIAESPQADREREQIRRLVARGLTREQVLDQLVQDYGPGVLASPEPRGFYLSLYLVPLLAGLALLLTGLIVLPRWRRAAKAAPEILAEPTALDPRDVQRLEDDLRLYR